MTDGNKKRIPKRNTNKEKVYEKDGKWYKEVTQPSGNIVRTILNKKPEER